jgi:hypothetical protein
MAAVLKGYGGGVAVGLSPRFSALGDRSSV